MSSTVAKEPEPEFFASRNYTGTAEKNQWRELRRWSRNWRYGNTLPTSNDPYGSQKENFRTRRSYFYFNNNPSRKALRIRFSNSTEIGAFAKLTNSYVLVGGDEQSDVFCRTVEGDLSDIPVIRASLAGCRIIGRMCAGNKHGVVVPETIYELELQHIKEQLPDSVEVKKVEERLSALGNVVACNDRVALVHPDLDKETEDVIADALQVEVYRCMIGTNPLVGSCSVLTNLGGLVSPEIGNDSLEDLSSLLELPLLTGTINRGNKVVASGLLANDSIVYAGMGTTSKEFTTIEEAFDCDRKYWMSFL